MLARIAMMAMTTSSSIRVKDFFMVASDVLWVETKQNKG
jgi:hypothetical protein